MIAARTPRGSAVGVVASGEPMKRILEWCLVGGVVVVYSAIPLLMIGGSALVLVMK
jgi:hypothetical protein